MAPTIHYGYTVQDCGYETPCHVHDGPLTGSGYGWAPQVNGVRLSAHAQAWVDRHGPVPAGMRVLHKCDVPACRNADHLFLGTQAQNMADKAAKGRSAAKYADETYRMGKALERCGMLRISAGKAAAGGDGAKSLRLMEQARAAVEPWPPLLAIVDGITPPWR